MINIIDAREMDEKKLAKAIEQNYWLKDTMSEESLDLPSFSFYFEGGLKSLIAHYNTYQKPLHKNIFYVEKQHEDVGVEVALQYVDDLSTKIVPFANNIYNL